MKKLIVIRGRFKKSHVAVAVLICVLFYTEFLVYYLNSYKWHQLKCKGKEPCVKILLVADPQIIGKQNEVIHFLTPLNIWDSDRYLSVTYQHIFNFVQPDVVIFLGDLFDEGSIATELDFKDYVERLLEIFSIKQNSNIQYIWLPGDNDIGGEGADIVTAKKINKFNHAFPQSDKVQYKNITFYTINLLVQYIPEITDNNDFLNKNVKIGLSHVPIFKSFPSIADKVFKQLQPNVLFTAHEHKSKIITYNTYEKKDRQIQATDPKSTTNKFEFSFNSGFLYEFMVPTCSYRMGTANMGYGYAIIDSEKVQYTVLWSPTRFSTLIFYCLILIIIAPVLLLKILRKLCRIVTCGQC